MNSNRLSSEIFEALQSGAGIVVPNAQRQAQLRAAWAATQRDSGRKVWSTPRVTTLAQLAESRLREQSAAANAPDPVLSPAAEWAALRELRRGEGGIAEARALLASARTLADWRLPRSAAALGASPEATLLADALRELRSLAEREHRRPLRELIETLQPAPGRWVAAGFGALPPLSALALGKLGVSALATVAESAPAPLAIATAENDDHEIELIAAWCRAQLERDPQCRLLIVDAQLRARRRAYERLLSQTLTPSEWVARDARRFSTVFAIEGGQPLGDFPLIAHALLTLRLLTGRMPLHDVVRWLRLPFLDRTDVFAGAAIEAALRRSRHLEYGAAELASFLAEDRGDAARDLASRLRASLALLAGERRSASEWAPLLLKALRAAGWHGSRALRSDEQQTVARWNALLDEYSALGAWLPRTTASAAVDTLADLAAEHSFDPASVSAPITLTDSHDDPVVRFDAVWVAGLDAAQWPAAPRPDVFIPLRLQTAAGIPWASAAGQTGSAHASLAAWRAAAGEVVCSWARLDGDAHRTASPLLARIADASLHAAPGAVSLASTLRADSLESVDDTAGIAVDRTRPVAGGVGPLTLQAECGFHAYAEYRLAARGLETPAPGLDRRDRGLLLHKALELVWLRLDSHFNLKGTEPRERRPMISGAVEAAVAAVFRGRIPAELAHAVDRERMRLERLIEQLLEKERERAPFRISALESPRDVSIAGGTFALRIDRIDAIEGGGYAILDYKAGEPRSLRWGDAELRDPQLVAYLLAERGRDVQALSNVFLSSDAATFKGKASRLNLLPGVLGLSASKVPAEEIEAAWHTETTAWIEALRALASDYLAGHAPVEPAPDVCRNCKLTVLCRRLELAEQVVEDDFDV